MSPLRPVLGVDEAGRSSPIGPMTIGGYGLVHLELLNEVRGLRDSKLITSEYEREVLALQLVKLAEMDEGWENVHILSPKRIDEAVKTHGLNRLETRVVEAFIFLSHAEEVWIDPYEHLLEQKFIGRYQHTGIRIHAPPQADALIPIVMAASILARAERDRLMRIIREDYGEELSSGDLGCPGVWRFQDRMVATGERPPIIRYSWKSWRRRENGSH